MRSRPALFTTTAVLELGTGAALFLVPGTVIQLLLGAAESSAAAAAMLVARAVGLGLIALGMAAWLRRDDGAVARSDLLSGMLVYNVAIGIALAVAGTLRRQSGVLLWPVVVLHGAMAIWCVLFIRARNTRA
jgi:hypothetical protein